MKNWFLKTFFRDKLVRVLVLDESGRLHESYEISKDPTTVTIKRRNQTFMLSRDASMISTKDNIPTYLLVYNNAEPIDLHTFPESNLTMEQFNIAIKHNTVGEVLRDTESKFKIDANLVTLVIVLCGFVLLGYFLNDRINKLENKIFPSEPAPIVEEVDDEQTDEPTFFETE